MIKPMGTLICQRCGSIQVGKLDLKCDTCGLPNWDVEELKAGLLALENTPPEPVVQADACTCRYPYPATINKFEGLVCAACGKPRS